ncbi:MAG: ABC transporter permease [Gemmatimonadales bacterium]
MVVRAFRTFRIATWLGWQIQSNWTDPLLFFIYSVARPLGGTLILVFMFFVVAGGRRGEMLDFFVVGAAFWPLVVFAMQGVAWAVLEDREHFKTIRYVYTAPIPFWAYLVGRGFALAAVGLSATAITIAVGIIVLRIPIVLPLERIPYFLTALLLGMAGLLVVGMILAGSVFLVSGEAWRLPDAVGQALYLVCGAVFPITVLPNWLEPLARIIPITYWLEAMRRSLLPAGGARSLPAMSDGAVLAALALVTVAAAVVSALVYVVGLTRARQKGILDAATGY